MSYIRYNLEPHKIANMQQQPHYQTGSSGDILHTNTSDQMNMGTKTLSSKEQTLEYQ
jgi:hypothetical protein